MAMNTENDFSPDFQTHNEIRYCESCAENTLHRVGVHEQETELTRHIIHLKYEYSHCSECANTRTIQLEKTITPKAE